MGVISNGTTLLDAGALDSGVPTGKLTLIKTLTASSSSTLSFIDGAASVVLDDTYGVYIIKFINVHPQTNDTQFGMQFNAAGAADFNETITNTIFKSRQEEDASPAELALDVGGVLTQETGLCKISHPVGNLANEALSGHVTLYNPSSTTFLKNFISVVNHSYPSASADVNANGQTMNIFTNGYINTASAIDEVKFQFVSGNIESGTIQLFGLGASA